MGNINVLQLNVLYAENVEINFYLKLEGFISIIVLLFFRGMFQAIQLPAFVALVPQMVLKNQISRINGLNSILNNTIYTVTPVVGALILEIVSIDYILWIDVLTFLVAVGTLIVVSVPSASK